MRKILRQRLIDKDFCIGTIVSIPSPEIAEMLSLCGFDWLFIDMEHGAFGGVTVQRILQAVAGRSQSCRALALILSSVGGSNPLGAGHLRVFLLTSGAVTVFPNQGGWGCVACKFAVLPNDR